MILETIHIYHTNDLHSHFEHWPRIHQLLTSRKKWHQQEGDAVFLFDLGDHMDRCHPYSDGTKGQGNTLLLNEAQYDAITIGNNEGITLAYDDLDRIYSEAEFSVLVANLYDTNGIRPSWVKPYQLYKTKSGTNIAVIGLTVFFAHFYEILGWKLTDPFEELRIQLEMIKEQADVIILLSHLGIHDDERIAEQFPEIDVILGAHTHHIFHEGKCVNNALMGAAGKYGMFVGHIELNMDEKEKTIVDRKAWLYDTNELPVEPDEKNKVDELYETGVNLLNQEVITLPESLDVDLFSESELTSLLCESLREWCEADCAFLNVGLLLNGLQEGVITKFDLLNICPHPINPCVVELSGAELKETIFETEDEKWAHLQVKGFGFRGTVLGKMIYNQITVNDTSRGREVFINNEPLQPRRIYKLAIPDLFTFGRFFPNIFRAKHKTYFMPEFMRDLLEWKLQQLYR